MSGDRRGNMNRAHPDCHPEGAWATEGSRRGKHRANDRQPVVRAFYSGPRFLRSTVRDDIALGGLVNHHSSIPTVTTLPISSRAHCERGSLPVSSAAMSERPLNAPWRMDYIRSLDK